MYIEWTLYTQVSCRICVCYSTQNGRQSRIVFNLSKWMCVCWLYSLTYFIDNKCYMYYTDCRCVSIFVDAYTHAHTHTRCWHTQRVCTWLAIFHRFFFISSCSCIVSYRLYLCDCTQFTRMYNDDLTYVNTHRYLRGKKEAAINRVYKGKLFDSWLALKFRKSAEMFCTSLFSFFFFVFVCVYFIIWLTQCIKCYTCI